MRPSSTKNIARSTTLARGYLVRERQRVTPGGVAGTTPHGVPRLEQNGSNVGYFGDRKMSLGIDGDLHEGQADVVR